jgi:hypothetical protein
VEPSFLTINGKVIRGHKVASLRSRDYPFGTIEKQKPIFKRLGLDLDRFFNGTLNISISPMRWLLKDPEFTFELVEWTELHPPETFSFVSCTVRFKDPPYEGWIYFPHPETKLRHFQDPTVIEVIAEDIKGLHYGDEVQIIVAADRVQIFEQARNQ